MSGITGFDRDNQEIQKYLVKAINRLAQAIETMNENNGSINATLQNFGNYMGKKHDQKTTT